MLRGTSGWAHTRIRLSWSVRRYVVAELSSNRSRASRGDFRRPKDSLPAGVIGCSYFRDGRFLEILDSNSLQDSIWAWTAFLPDDNATLAMEVKREGPLEAQAVIADSGCCQRKESNPHGPLGRAIQAMTIQIGPRSRRLSCGPRSGKDLGGREKVGQGLATLPGRTPGLPGRRRAQLAPDALFCCESGVSAPGLNQRQTAVGYGSECLASPPSVCHQPFNAPRAVIRGAVDPRADGEKRHLFGEVGAPLPSGLDSKQPEP